MSNKNSWDYERPINLWESMPWWMRWPLAIAAVVYFGLPIIAIGTMLAVQIALHGISIIF